MKHTHILGIGISKKSFDVSLGQNKDQAPILHLTFDNNLKGYKLLRAWLKNEKVSLASLLICLENTGMYHRALVCFLQTKSAFVLVENPVEIKWSMGLSRGKNDKVDAQRIAL